MSYGVVLAGLVDYMDQHGSNTTEADTSVLQAQDPQEVNGATVLWALLALAVTAMSQRSYNLDKWPITFGLSEDTPSLIRCSPLICLLESLRDVTMILRRISMARSRTHKSGESSQHQGKQPRDRQYATAFCVKLALFLFGPLPQAIKLFALRGVPWSQACAAVFLFSIVTNACASSFHDITKAVRRNTPLDVVKSSTEESIDKTTQAGSENMQEVVDMILLTHCTLFSAVWVTIWKRIPLGITTDSIHEWALAITYIRGANVILTTAMWLGLFIIPFLQPLLPSRFKDVPLTTYCWLYVLLSVLAIPKIVRPISIDASGIYAEDKVLSFVDAITTSLPTSLAPALLCLLSAWLLERIVCYVHGVLPAGADQSRNIQLSNPSGLQEEREQGNISTAPDQITESVDNKTDLTAVGMQKRSIRLYLLDALKQALMLGWAMHGPFVVLGKLSPLVAALRPAVVWLAFAEFHLVSVACYYLLAFDSTGTLTPAWLASLG